MIPPVLPFGSPETLGQSIPPLEQHALSVSLPTWLDNVGYQEGEKTVVDAMVTGYPRFVIHKSILKLADICQAKFGKQNEQCMMFPSWTYTQYFGAFLINYSVAEDAIRCIQYPFLERTTENHTTSEPKTPVPELYVVFFPQDFSKLARQFWQHTGMGISSRRAEWLLALIGYGPVPPIATTNTAALAKRAIRQRIASLVTGTPIGVNNNLQENSNNRGPVLVTEDDVFLFPCGMTAIWTAYQLVMELRPGIKSVCFGFPYADTLKVQQKWGPGCHFFGDGKDSDLDALEAFLDACISSDPTTPPISALFTELPSNPLLRSPNLLRLRQLADKYNFLIAIDETIGNFHNVSILSYADIVMSSLTKIFSGEANTMGGSLVINPRRMFYLSLKRTLQSKFEDAYFGDDAVVMERNSRQFEQRIKTINENAVVLCEYLKSRSLMDTDSKTMDLPMQAPGMQTANDTRVIKHVFYPKWTTRSNYDLCRNSSALATKEPNFGGLFSLTFTSMAASEAFFNTLRCHKGPSLGTSFTLVCPYTLLAHYFEMDWAAKYGVEEGLVRVSVGTEDINQLMGWFTEAVKAAEYVAKQAR